MILNPKLWEDVSIYAVDFLTDEVTERKIHKVLVFPTTFTTQDIQKAVIENFYQVKKVTLIEVQLDGLLLNTHESESIDY
ncbi:hypothetical protein AB6887_01700 [Carnobacterium divergens]|uniref:Uncharacterized protein n=1 Tax=Carnobacterium divergens TaxID=2748 RepID=A0A7Z8D0C7_CARDV|nr:hypothetical protein [Carnobacterium divergens]MPQ22684.1 hypothetical protein [Carnobacterium divergens]TFI72737.1 hypothetical protein CKN58_07080 [Carnobacterium divergens]TFI77176.1 hypothetical protein CKN85_07120 [Carnobacterium divergens]TFI83477.1 hypothetical protein CKN56_07160 [Carnobacterium divergens]TFI95582.1 hypothetical protein CKN64_07100 [Carnobacterium divergens]